MSTGSGQRQRSATPLPSSTVILLRDHGGHAPPFEVLMAKRHGSVTFPGVHAFPGGILEESDGGMLGAGLPPEQRWADGEGADRPPDALRYWVAALRETFEEVGLLLAYRNGAVVEGPLPDDVLALRDRLHAGASFADVLREIDAVPATDRVYSFARWVTPSANPRRFDTRFVVSRLPRGQEPVVDGTETESCTWLTPVAALEAYEAGEIELIPPTIRTLDDLARFVDVDAVLASAARRAIRPACPEIEIQGERVTMRYPSPCPDDPLPDRRLILQDGRWRPLPS